MDNSSEWILFLIWETEFVSFYLCTCSHGDSVVRACGTIISHIALRYGPYHAIWIDEEDGPQNRQEHCLSKLIHLQWGIHGNWHLRWRRSQNLQRIGRALTKSFLFINVLYLLVTASQFSFFFSDIQLVASSFLGFCVLDKLYRVFFFRIFVLTNWFLFLIRFIYLFFSPISVTSTSLYLLSAFISHFLFHAYIPCLCLFL